MFWQACVRCAGKGVFAGGCISPTTRLAFVNAVLAAKHKSVRACLLGCGGTPGKVPGVALV